MLVPKVYKSVLHYFAIISQSWDAFHLSQIESGNVYAKKCRAGRFHTSYKVLSKAIRALMLFEGEGVLQHDIKNCQLLLLMAIKRERDRRRKEEREKEKWKEEKREEGCTGCIPLWRTVPTKCQFQICCEAGQIYEQLLSEMSGLTLFDVVPFPHRKGQQNRPLVRDDIKDQLIILMFDRNEHVARMKIWPYFEGLYPDIATLLSNRKTPILTKRTQRTPIKQALLQVWKLSIFTKRLLSNVNAWRPI